MNYPASIQSLMDEFNAQTSPVDGSRARLWQRCVEIDLLGGQSMVVLNHMKAKVLRQGYGADALNFLTTLADKHQVKIYTHAMPRGHIEGNISQDSLADLALAHGFEEEGDYDLIYTPNDPMKHSKLG